MAVELKIKPPYMLFTDSKGKALENGKIYIGQAGLEPVGNAVQVYSNPELTEPVSQPIRTSGGYPVVGSTFSPVVLYVKDLTSYSILVLDKNDNLVYSNLDTGNKIFTELGVADPTVAGVSAPLHTLGYNNETPPRYFIKTGPLDTDWLLFQFVTQSDLFVYAKDYGTVADGVTDDSAAFQQAIDTASNLQKPLVLHPGHYVLTSNVLNESENDLTILGSAGVTIEPRGSLRINCSSTTLTLSTNANRGDQTVTVSDASSVSVGDVVYLKSDIVAETLRNRPHRFLAKVTSIAGNVITLSDKLTLNFHIGDSGLEIGYSKSRRVLVDGINVLQSGGSRAIDFLFCKGLITNCNFSGDAGGYLSVLDYCHDLIIKNCIIENLFYGFQVQSCYNVRFRDIISNDVKGHPIVPNFWSRNIFVDGLTGEGNSSIMDSHEAFNVHYSNVYTTSDQNYSNIRSAGGSLRNSSIESANQTPTFIYFQNIDFASTPHDYSGLNKEYSFVIDNLIWKSLDRFSVSKGKNVTIRNSEFLDLNNNPAGIDMSGGAVDSIDYLSVLNCRFDEFGSRVRCTRNDARDMRIPGIVKAEDTGAYDGAIVGNANITTAGTGYSDASSVPLTGGTGTGATVNIVTSAGAVTSATFADFGTGYNSGEALTISGGGGNAVVTVGRANVCQQTLAVKSGIMGEMGGAFRRYSAVLNELFTQGGDVVFCLQIGWPRNNLDNGGGNGYSFVELSFLHYIRHANSGGSELKRTNFQGQLGASSQGIWPTPSHVSADTGQANATMQMEYIGGINDNPSTPASDKYFCAFFRLSSGRSNPFYGAIVDLNFIKTPN